MDNDSDDESGGMLSMHENMVNTADISATL